MNITANLETKADEETKKQAFRIFQSGVEHGDAVAMRNLGYSYGVGFGVAQDYAKAREWFEKAGDYGDGTSMFHLGRFYADGQGVAQNYAKAREWYEKAADKGIPEAMINLAIFYAGGNGVAQDYAKAREWLEKAADKGNAHAMYSLGELYENGHGVPQDYGKARDWYEKAADKGNEFAKSLLERLPIQEALTNGRYPEALRLQEALTAKTEALETKRDGKPGKETAGALVGVAWDALLVRDFAKALSVAERGHALLPDDLASETNRAHALLFLGREEEARALYLAHKGKPLSKEDDRLWERVIVEDFAELCKAGLTHPVMANIEKELGVSLKDSADIGQR